ncbi:PREDICTED: uncharacterized protein LOC108366422 [Rhagoletis zephyria]|uniref:uncharacterized protein LOC108366422 n=1 Tax=Rhagoletis zephyria TaxID=28612 RepID=UPI0008117207|nr:PREDICTED: uncharacterized protein LOC108366422 [Rhagoletis zephyria]
MATSAQGSLGQGAVGGNFKINFDPLKFINRMGEYNGSSAAELVQFVTKVEFLINSMSSYSVQSRKFVVLQIRDKIVGKVNTTLLRYSIDNTSWEDKKRILVENFSERNTFLQLREIAERIQHKYITQTYNELSSILTRMNNKYHLSEEKPIDRKPECNEEAILNLFKEKIPISAASIIISRDIKTLFEAYRILEQNNWTRSDRKYQFTKFNSSNVNKSDKNKYTSAPRNYQNYQRYQNVNQNQQNQVNQPSDLNRNYNQWQNKQPTVNARQQNKKVKEKGESQ